MFDEKSEICCNADFNSKAISIDYSDGIYSILSVGQNMLLMSLYYVSLFTFSRGKLYVPTPASVDKLLHDIVYSDENDKFCNINIKTLYNVHSNA